MKKDIIKSFQDEVSKIDTHYINVYQDTECERTLIGNIFEKYIQNIKIDLLKIADEGEYEDMRREIKNYFE